MAIRLVYRKFSFAATAENWVPVVGADTTATGTGGSLDMTIFGRNKLSLANNWTYTGSWQDILNYTTASNNTSSIVLSVTSSYQWRCSVYNVGHPSTDGPYKLQTAAGADIFEFVAGTGFSSTTTFATKTGNGAVPDGFNHPTASVRFYLENSLDTANNGSAQVTLLQDEIQITASIDEQYSFPQEPVLLNYRQFTSGFFFP